GSPDMTTSALARGSATASSAYAWVAFSLTPQVQLSRGAVYWVVLENAAASGGTGWSWWNTRNDTYIAPGVGEQSNSLGAKWGLAKGDFELRTFGYALVGVVLAMTADRLGVRTGDTLTYTLWLNNSGTAPAGVVWINDTLPAYVAYAWDNATDLGGVKVGDANWTFPGLLPGPHAFVLRVSVQAAAAPGAILTNVARLNYTDAAGASRPGSAVAITSIVIAGSDTPLDLSIPLGFGLLLGIALVAVVVVARRSGRVEEVFVGIAGRASAGLARQMKTTLFRVEDAYADVLADWSGYLDEVVGADRILARDLVESRGARALRRPRRRAGGQGPRADSARPRFECFGIG